ncbi:hypothetical protein TIFTF001_053420, partial [Ficus carica]
MLDHSCEYSEASLWLPCVSLSKALNLGLWPNVRRLTTGAWTGILPSSIFTTEDIGGRRVGDGLVHRSAKFSIVI